MAQALEQQTLDISKLKVSKFNSREQVDETEDEAFQELCQSIKLNGLINPIEVTQVNSHFEIIAGSRRFRACKSIGLKSIPVTIKTLDDTDARIDSLIENIHRIGLSDGEKKQSIKSIYKQWTDKEIVQFLARLRKEDKLISGIDRDQRSEKISKTTQQVFVPKEFESLCRRIGYAPVTQWGFFRAEEIRDEIVEKEPLLEQHPKVKKRVREQISRIVVKEKKGKKKAENIVQQAVHDIRTGALKEDKDTGEILNIPSKREKIDEVAAPSARRLRDEVIDLSKDLYQLVTDAELNMKDIDRAKQFATSNQATERMKDLVTKELGKGDLVALESAIVPLAKALNRFVGILEEVEE